MTDETNPQDKKLYVDEDWKSQVEAEKEAALHPEQKSQPADAAAHAHAAMPPADLSFIISTFHFQAAMALGLLPNPITKKSEVHLDQAKHSIDLLAMLQVKTQNNRTPEETELLDAVINELRWAFVSVSEQLGKKTG